MGQALRKLKVPRGSSSTSDTAVPVVKRKSVDIKPQPPEPQVIIEPVQRLEESCPDPSVARMSQQVVGIITTRPAGEKEHPTARITEEYTRPMPTDRHTTVLSGPDEDTIQSPGKLNHSHIRELFLLYQGKAEGQEKPLDVESLATRFNVDPELLHRVFQYTSLLHYEVPVARTRDSAESMKETTLQNVKDAVQHMKDADGFQVK